MLEKIEQLKQEVFDLIQLYGIQDERTIAKSKELNNELEKFMI